MNFLKNIYEGIINRYKSFEGKTNYIIIPSFIYINYINDNLPIKYIFNLNLLYILYKNRYFYINNFIDKILILKFNIYKFYDKFKSNNSFTLNKVLLYTNLKENYDVTNYFYKNKINKIDRITIIDTYNFLNKIFIYDYDIRLKIYFKYKNKNYIIYFPYEHYNIDLLNIYILNEELSNINLLNKDFNNYLNNYYLPYPPFTENIVNNMNKGI
jgi:hypothetical protein